MLWATGKNDKNGHIKLRKHIFRHYKNETFSVNNVKHD